MTPSQHRRAGELFEQASELAASDRAAFLEMACAGEPALRDRVLALLAAEEQLPPTFLGRPAMEMAAGLLAGESGLSGTQLGSYRLGRQIASGGMGTLYEAHDLRLDRRVAIKTLPAATGSDRERVQRFQQEARAISLLNHPNIVSIYDAAFDQGISYLATEFVEGQTLRQMVAAGPLDRKALLDIAIQICAALGAAHRAGVVHRDIKPENVMVRPDGIVKVLDFGLAKLQESSASDVLATRPGSIPGTLPYLSPEQVLGKPAGPQSDLFSLGVMLYELATGERPFTGPTDGAVFDAIVNQVPPHPRQVRPAIHRDLDAILMRAIEKDSDLRFQSADDLRAALRLLSRDSSSGVSAVPPAPPARWARWKVAAASAVAGAALVFAGWRLWPSPPFAGPAIHYRQLTDQAGEELFPHLSRDGTQFIYASPARGKWDIYLQRTGGSKPVNLTPDSRADNTQPAWSPDGTRIAFRSERDGGGLFVMEATGENPRRIAARGYWPAWSPDGRSLVYASETFSMPTNRGAAMSQLTVVDTVTAKERPLKTQDATQPQWSPHGYRIAYWSRVAGGRRDIVTVGASPGDNETSVAVTADPALDWNPVWSPSGDEIYFLSNRGGTMNLWRAAIDERSGRTRGEPVQVTMPFPLVMHFNLAGDGRTFAYVQSNQRSLLYRVDYHPDSLTLSSAVSPAGNGTLNIDNMFSFSPDRQWIVHDAIGQAQEDIFIVGADGSGRRRLTDDAAIDRFPAWSPDGRLIAFMSDRSGSFEEWVMKPDGSGLRQLTALQKMRPPLWSRDGRRILATRAPVPVLLDPEARSLVTVPVAAPGLAGQPGLSFYQWPPDRDVLLGEHSRDAVTELVTYQPLTGRLEKLGIEGYRPSWLPGSRQFVFARGSDCILYDPARKQERRLFTVAPNEIVGLDASSPGRIFFTQRIRDGDIWMGRFVP